ncbi:MAG: acyl-CoA/acyl-ACP dehydrogenase [Hyphomonadaceae bacterium]|nr:acyl-CoA/acyl-ACP dehydrogenase [Hyphomonadaceae bacterium]
MDFRYTQDQQDLIDAAKAVFDGENTLERMRLIVANEKVDDLWPQFSELGLLGIMAPESVGGLEQDLSVMAGIAEAAGYVALPESLVELAGISVPLLNAMGETGKIKQVLAGDLAVGVLSPLLSNNNQAVHCDLFIRTTRDGGEPVSVPKVKFETRQSIDPLRGLSSATQPGEHNSFVEHHGAVLTAAQLVGLSKRMVDMSVEYAKERHQFGKPIGSFQAIKHHLATVHAQIEFTRPMVQLAALQSGRAVHTAKIAAVDTAMLAAETAIQVHGGMGYTYEVDLHLFMKRAWALCGEWGDRNYHMKQLEDLILDGEAELGPGTSFAA